MPGAFPTVTGRALPIAERDTDGTALRSSGNHRQRSIWRHLGRRSYRRHRIGPGFRMDGRRPCSFGARSVRERPTSGSTAWTPMRIGPPGVDSMEPSLYAHLFAATQVLVLVWIGFEARARGKSPWRIVPLVPPAVAGGRLRVVLRPPRQALRSRVRLPEPVHRHRIESGIGSSRPWFDAEFGRPAARSQCPAVVGAGATPRGATRGRSPARSSSCSRHRYARREPDGLPVRGLPLSRRHQFGYYTELWCDQGVQPNRVRSWRSLGTSRVRGTWPTGPRSNATCSGRCGA